MCEIMERIVKEENARAVEIAQWETKRENVQCMLKMGLSKKTIMKALSLTDEEYSELAAPLAG